MSFRPLEHTADTGIEVRGASVAELFAEAARGMFSLIYGTTGKASEKASVSLSADTLEDLLVDWLSELLYLSEARGVAFSHFVVRLDDHVLQAEAEGVSSEEAELIGPPIKAVTYHQLQVSQDSDGWRASVIFDV